MLLYLLRLISVHPYLLFKSTRISIVIELCYEEHLQLVYISLYKFIYVYCCLLDSETV